MTLLFLALYNVEKLLSLKNIGERKSRRGGVRCLLGILCYTSTKMTGYRANGYIYSHIWSDMYIWLHSEIYLVIQSQMAVKAGKTLGALARVTPPWPSATPPLN